MPHQEFEDLVADALDSLPKGIHDLMDNVAVVVAHQPTADQLTGAGLRPGDVLFGLYVGIPKTKRGANYGEVLPDKILIFQRPIERACRTRAEIREQVRRTVLHEIGHHFGLDEEELRTAGV
jgi:predicted Zn-dependent protease with MMP-like domain